MLREDEGSEERPRYWENSRPSSFLSEFTGSEIDEDEFGEKLRIIWQNNRSTTTDSEYPESETPGSSCSLPLKTHRHKKSRIPRASSNGSITSATKTDRYDLNGDRDFMYFNITEYKDHTLNRIGSKEDGKILERTLNKKKFVLKASMDEQMDKKCIAEQLQNYVKDVNDKQRDVKVLLIAFMAHGDEDDRIIFSDKSSCKYKYDLMITKLVFNFFQGHCFNQFSNVIGFKAFQK